ncbi:MAG: hypothetical protein J6M12_00490 [Clostridia bacterium]|nr:hypothetical protein [Clostridia bacterium]
MKKFLSIALALMLLVSACVLTSCDEMTAYELVHSALAKMETLDSFEADVKMSMKMSMDMEGLSQTMDIPLNMAIKASGLKSETPLTSGTMSMTMMGMETKADIYSDSKDVYVATTVMNQTIKAKMAVDSAEAEEYDLTDTTSSFMVEIPEESLKDVAIVESEDGTKSIEVALDPAVFAENYSELIEQVNDSSAGGEVDNITLSNIKVKVVVSADGYIAGYYLEFTMDMDVTTAGVSVATSTVVSASVEYKNPGTPVTVDVPTDLDSYKGIG